MANGETAAIPLSDLEFVAFDTETTGLNATFHRMVELGAVKFHPGSEVTVPFATLVNPGVSIPAEVIAIHGITDTMVADSPSAGPVLQQFIDFCGPNAVLLAHNAPFDLSFVACESDRAGLSFPDLPVLDTVTIARACLPGLPYYSLEALTTGLNLAPSQDHRALADAHLVRSLLEFCLTRRPAIVSLADLFELCPPDLARHYLPGAVTLPEHLSAFQTAIEQKLRIEIEYRSAGSRPESRIIRPLQLQSRRSVVYITAFCEKAQAERTFRADRIIRFHLVSDRS